MEKEYLKLDGDRQKLGKLLPASAERGPLKKRMFATVALIAGNDINYQIQILIKQAQKLSEDGLHSTAQTLAEREILSQAMALLEASGKLWRNYEEQYTDAYGEAWLKTLEYFYRHHREYDPSKAQVATWLNFRLKNEFTSQKIKIQQEQQHQIQASTEEEGEGLLAMMASPSYGDQAQVMSEGIAQWLEESPELAEESLKNQPQLTVKLLLEQRFLREVPWGDLAKEHNVSVPTLSSFYERKCRPKLINFIQNNYDFITPDTPLNPCEHLRSLLTEKQWKNLNLGDRLQQWLESEPTLQAITLPGKPDVTAQIFLRETLAVIQQPRQGLTQVAGKLEVEPGALERFYEFRVIHQVLEFVHKIQQENR